MTDIKQVSDWALTIAAEAAGSKLHHYERMADDNRLAQSIEAHARAIEQHEAYKREVSDAVERVFDECQQHIPIAFKPKLRSFITAKPDPLVEAIREMALTDATCEDADRLRAALAARGLEIREKQT